MLFIRCDVLLKFLCMLFWRIYGRRDVYFLNIYYIRVFYRFNRSRTIHVHSLIGLSGDISTCKCTAVDAPLLDLFRVPHHRRVMNQKYSNAIFTHLLILIYEIPPQKTI